MPVKMPSDCDPPLPRSVLRGTRTPSQNRCRLALTLPGSDWLGSAGHTHKTTCGPENKLPNISTSLTMTTNTLLSTDLNLSSSSSSLLTLTTQSTLTSTQPPFTTSSSLLSSSLTSTNILKSSSLANLDASFSALTSDASYSPSLSSLPSKSSFMLKGEIASHSLTAPFTTNTCSSDAFLKHDLHSNNFESSSKCTVTSLVPSHVDISLKPSLSWEAENLHSLKSTTKMHCDGQSSNILAQPSVVDSSLLHTQISEQANSEDVELYEHDLPEDSSIEESESSDTASSSDEFDGSCSPKPLRLADGELSAQEKLQVVGVSDIIHSQRSEALLKEKKMAFISTVCCSLVNSPNFSDPSDLTRDDIKTLCEEMEILDPEFVLKVALYTRQELNIRSTANFLLAMAAMLPACRPHLRRYLCPAVQLPSDWMDVPRLYQSLAGEGDRLVPLPSCLRRALTLKFQEFSEYQLAKYNTRVQRGKLPSKKKKQKKTRVPKPVTFGRNLKAVKVALDSLQQQFDEAESATPEKKTKKKDQFSLKSLIQRLHISKPAYHVMSLLGRRYPKELTTYSRSGLEGPWQSNLAGSRMRLKQPETWDRELSQKGNIAAVWEGLLDRNKVPFMALLRNLRNLLRAGISKKHHRDVTARLTNKHAVIQSRLFPFRFLSAYKVIQDLESQVTQAKEPFPTNAALLQRIFRREGRNNRKLARINLSRYELRACLAVPAVHQLLKREKKGLRRARNLNIDDETLQSYKESLEEAVQISALYNIPPIPGRTVILLYVDYPMEAACHGAKELATQLSSSTNHWGRKTPTLLDVGVLLSLMVQETAENAELVLMCNSSFALAERSTAPLLQRVGEIIQQANDLSYRDREPLEEIKPDVEVLTELLMKRRKVDTLLYFTFNPCKEEFRSVLNQYRRDVNAECLFVSVLPHGNRSEDSSQQAKDVTLCGFTEQVLKYLAERGTDRLLDHVEKVDERFKVPEDPEKARKNQVSSDLLATVPKQRWRSVRVFISSTFRDMHSERDLLIGQVMPQLRQRAASHFLSIEEVDLRWGITEEEAKKDRQLSLCLSEVVRSQIFIGILGERYGYIPKAYSVPHLPEYEWIHTYPSGRSITELEAMQFLQACGRQKNRHAKAFFYFRNPDIIGSVPSHWLTDFVAESQEASKRLTDLKKKLAKHPATKDYQYSCKWGGELNGKPHITDLDDFGAKVLEDIWQLIERDFIKESNTSEDDDHLAQEGFQEWHRQHSYARSKLVKNVCSQILEQKRTNGKLFLVVGEPSQGKTVFMADLVKELRLEPSSSVIFHFTEATPSAKEAETMLSDVCKQLSHMLQQPTCAIASYRALLLEFKVLLRLISRSLKRNNTLTLLIDGADKLIGHSGELTSDWIPEILPQRVNLVLSVTEGSSLCSSLSKRKDTVQITLGRLEPSERAELVRGKLALYGKKLEETAFNNQLRLLMIKKGTRDPLYLTMACEELRMNAIFEKLSDDIQKLPATLPLLIQKRLEMLEEEHGVTNVAIALTAICVSRMGLWERDLLRILSSAQEMPSVYTSSWNEMLFAATHAKNIPMATYSLLLTGLKSVIGMWNHNVISEPRLHLSSHLLREAIEKRYFGKPENVRTVHLLMAAHFWEISSPEDPESSPSLHAESLSELSHHLLCAMQLRTLGRLLSHIPFLKAHASLGLLTHICQIYSRYDVLMSENRALVHEISEPPVKVFREFIERSLHILSQNPSLFYQLALNEPDTSPVCIQAQELLADSVSAEAQLITAWNNKPSSRNVCSSKLLAFPSVPGCVGLSSKGDLAMVGTSDGALHILQTNSGEETRTLYSGCDGISTCTFISEAIACIGSYDGIMEIWNIADGCRLNRFEAHRRQITGCCVSADRKQLVTCSLDFQLKSWDIGRCSLLSSTTFSSPLNCVAFHPRGHAVVVGSWDGKITVVTLEKWKRIVILCDSSSIRTVSFSMDGSVLVSGTLDGWVSLWSWEAQVQLSHFRAHGGSTLTTNFLLRGEYLLTGGEDGKVQVSSGGLGRLHGQACVKYATSAVLALALSPNREWLAVGYHSDSVCIYSVATGVLESQCSVADVPVGSLVWLSNNTLVTGSGDGLIRVWNILPGQSVVQLNLTGHQRPVLALALSSKFLASASEDVSVCLWSVESLSKADPSITPVCVLRSHTAAVMCCSFSPDGKLLATGGQDRSVLCWDLSLNPPVLLSALRTCHKDWVTGCSWAANGLLISCSGDGAVSLWDIQKGNMVLTFAGHQSAVSSVTCMGDRVISSGRDGSLKVWSLTGLEVANIATHHNQLTQSAAYWEPEDSRDDAALVVYTAGSDGSILKWSPLQMEQIQTLYGHGGAVTSSASYPQHEISITAAYDGSVCLWGAPCRDECVMETRHKGSVSAVAWSPDGELVVSGGVFGDLIVWKQQKPLLTLQCGELKISSIVFTTQRSFCVISNDMTLSRWILLPCKGGGFRAKKAYSVGTELLVLSALPTPSLKVQLHMLSGKVSTLEPKTGTLQEINVEDSLMPEDDFKPPQEEPSSVITVSKKDFGVCDSNGALWICTKQESDSSSWKWERQQVHSASVSCLEVLNNLVITASADRSVKIWQCNPFKQVGVFFCDGAVTCMSVSPPCDSSPMVCHIACGDQHGNLYLLTCLQI